MSKKVVLAFSGGLDTSFCVPWLIDEGYDVITVFVDTGGVSDEELDYIETRSAELGAIEHRTLNIGDELVEKIVHPMLWGGQWYQGYYPLLCSDRYLIVEHCLKVCDEVETPYIAHGCTAMGNDQVRFDLSVPPGYQVIAPIRKISEEQDDVRAFEIEYLAEKGFEVAQTQKSYTINENLLGVTVSGGAIDEWAEPPADSYVWVARPGFEASDEQRLQLGIREGKFVTLEGAEISGQALLQALNQVAAEYGIGRGSYTGDTTIGLKGRIGFEAPGLYVMKAAMDAIVSATSSRAQNDFKPMLAQRWVELVYHGLYADPLRTDLEQALESLVRRATGSVDVVLRCGRVEAVAVESENILQSSEARYAQSAGWTAEQAYGFVKLYGQNTQIWLEKGQ